MSYKSLFIKDKKILKTVDDTIKCARVFFESFSIDYEEEDLVKISFEVMEFERARHWVLEDALYFLKDFKEDLFISRFYQIGLKLDSARKEDLRILSPYLIQKMRMDDKFKKLCWSIILWDGIGKRLLKKLRKVNQLFIEILKKSGII